MIRTIALLITLALPAQAQDVELPDITQLRSADIFDLSSPPPMIVQQAIAAAEDPDYFDRFPAFSPISQSVVRNTLLSNSRTLTRAVMEIRLGVDLANAFSREEIITMFSQRVYLGASCYGFSDALEYRLGTTLENATLSEALTLAVLMKAPMSYENDLARFSSRFDYVAIAGQDAGFWDVDVTTALMLDGPSAFLADARCPADY